MSYNGSGTFNANSAGLPVVTATVISSTMFNAAMTDLATGLTNAICKDGQSACTARIPFANGINSTLATDATNTITGSILTAGGLGVAKALWVGGLANIAGALTVTGHATMEGVTSTGATGTGALVFASTPTLVTPVIGVATGTSLALGAAGVATGVLTFKGTTSGTVTLSVADAAGTWTLKLPTSAGTADFAQITDGSGNASWVTGQSIAGLKTSSTPQFTGLILGTNPATSGTISLANSSSIFGRNAANSGNIHILGLDSADHVVLSNSGNDVQWGPALIALGGGAAPTLGTIGGSGPATAAQYRWMRLLDSGGVAFWIPVWK